MGNIKIIADGSSRQAQAQARGKLFEKLMADVLRFYGYEINNIPNVNYSGMEIDIEGKSIATGIPLYAECKCYDTEVDSPKIQAFFGKYMTKWFSDKRCQGLFIALPGINSHAQAFYKDNCENRNDFTLRLLQEKEVLDVLLGTNMVTQPEVIAKSIPTELGRAGDWVLIYSDKGIYFVQYIIKYGEGIPTMISIFNSSGDSTTNKSLIDYFLQLYPELNDFELINIVKNVSTQPIIKEHDEEEIVEVRGSSECFEFQFPAAPEYFVGRQYVHEEIDSLVEKILYKATSFRGTLFEANSGWGKSSAVLSTVHQLLKSGHFALAIDSRSASSSQYILRVVDYTIKKFNNFEKLFEFKEAPSITGFDGIVNLLIEVGKELEQQGKLLFIFLDQFENVFFLQDALKRIRDVIFKLSDAQTNVVVGFSWKTDLFVGASEFPYQLRDDIISKCFRITLKTFSNEETKELLNKLSIEIKAPLRKDLEFFLSEFSQGYPWLLKKLCAHVKSQRQKGVPQLDIANSLLNVEELFKEDLRGLSAAEEDTLRRIAKVAPVSILDLGEKFRPEIVQSLVNARLLVRVANKYDIYWDIFRDYLNSERIPAQENYIVHVNYSKVYGAAKLLVEAGGSLPIPEFLKKISLSEKSFYNFARDMRLLGVAEIIDNEIKLIANLSKDNKLSEDLFRFYLKERLKRNRLICRISEAIESSGFLSICDVGDILEKSCPYISASKKTWDIYARNFAIWMDAADIAILNGKDNTLMKYEQRTEIRQRFSRGRSSRSSILFAYIQYKPIEKTLVKIVEAIEKGSRVNWSGLSKSTITKALTTLEYFGFIRGKTSSIELLPLGLEFVKNIEKRHVLFASGALKMKSFEIFVQILDDYKEQGLTLLEISQILMERLDTSWKKSTAETNVKIMMDWARHTKLAPGVFAKIQKGPRKGWKNRTSGQCELTL